MKNTNTRLREDVTPETHQQMRSIEHYKNHGDLKVRKHYELAKKAHAEGKDKETIHHANKAIRASNKSKIVPPPSILRKTNEETTTVKLDEKFIDGREYASHGLIHPEHAALPIHQKTGQDIDFYASDTGNKISGKVTKNDGKHVHIQAHKTHGGKLHTFKVTPHLPETKAETQEVIHKYKVGDKVVPSIGPHKNYPHEVIHVHSTGEVNIRPIGLRGKQIRYAQGAVKAQPHHLEYYGFGRYGKDHHVTHTSQDGKLVPVAHPVKESVVCTDCGCLPCSCKLKKITEASDEPKETSNELVNTAQDSLKSGQARKKEIIRDMVKSAQKKRKQKLGGKDAFEKEPEFRPLVITQ